MSNIRNYAIKCIQEEAQALLDLIPQLTDDFDKVVQLILNCKGKLIITGVGKSGHIGAKIAATLASTGTPSFFVNPLDAFHGDLGMITTDDIVLAISYSGQTDELLRFIPYLLERKIPLIGMSGNPDSLLAKYADYHLNIAVKKEACPLNLAPTSSTTVALVMGDALACALMALRKFEAKDFAQFHPGGTLGRRLLMKVKDVMRTEKLPIVKKDATISDLLTTITKGRLGIAIVVENNKVLGLVTSGDIRRAIQENKDIFFNLKIEEIMNAIPVVIHENESLSNADNLFKERNLNTLLVLDGEENFIGILDIRKM